eukprot:COSAG01_NODE_4938_length_4609_cov_4.379157_3_plen_102_part_00
MQAHQAGRYFEGAILEILIYNRSLSDAELVGVEAFLAARHGLLASTFRCAAPAEATAAVIGGRLDLTQAQQLFVSFEKAPLPARIAETPEQTWLAAARRAR